MVEELRILMAEDMLTDAELVMYHLKKGGIVFTARRVETREAFIEELDAFAPDIVLSDYMMPRFTGREALEIVKERQSYTPLIIVTGSMNEETAVECMRGGAADYVIKEHLTRLPMAVISALEAKAVRADRERAQDGLRVAAREWRASFDAINEAVSLLDAHGVVLRCNQSMRAMLARPWKEIMGTPIRELLAKAGIGLDLAMIAQAQEQRARQLATFPHGERWIHASVDPVLDKEHETLGTVLILADVTERKRAVERIDHLNVVLRSIRNVNQLITKEKDLDALLKGCCDALVSQRGYSHAWVVLFNDAGEFRTASECGLGQSFDVLRSDFERNQLSECARNALLAEDVPVITEAPKDCSDCPLCETKNGYDSMAIRIAYDDRIYGVLCVALPPGIAHDQEECSLFSEVAGDIAFALQNMRLEAERVAATREIHELARFPSENPNPVMRVGEDGTVLYANEAAWPLLMTWQTKAQGTLPEQWLDVIRQTLESGSTFRTEESTGDGAYALAFAPVRASGYVNIYGMDITERRGAEKRLEASHRLLRVLYGPDDVRALLERFLDEVRDVTGCSSLGVRLLDEEGNLPFEVLRGLDREFCNGCRPLSIGSARCVCANVASGRTDPALDYYTEGGSFAVNDAGDSADALSHYGFDGARKACLEAGYQSIAIIPIRSGRITQGVLYIADVRENMLPRGMVHVLERATTQLGGTLSRMRTEAENARLVAAIEHAGEAILVTDAGGVIQYVNPAFERITGYHREEASGNTPRMLKSGKQSQAFYEELWTTIQGGDVWSGRLVNKRKDGKLYEEEATISPVYDGKGQIAHYVGVKRDITEQETLERRLRQAQKLEAIGTLAGGIAHDFNNALAAIVGYTQMCAEELPEDSTQRADLDHVLAAARRSTDLVRQILTFSRQVEQERTPIRLHHIVKETIKLLRPSLPATIQVSENVDTKCAPVLADPTQMHQVLMNLCTNAYHAMREGGGTLTVQLESFSVDEDFLTRHPSLQVGPHVKLTVSDTGHGMDPQTMARIFDPFFTTKNKGEGTGLGLATVHGIVQSHGGEIAVASKPGAGSEFEVYLPCVVAERAEEHLDRAPIRGGHERILVVDDEQDIAEMTAKTLQKFGYEAVPVTSGTEALAAFSADPDLFDLLVTDFTMPKMTGDVLAKEIHQLRPRVPVILTTGFNEKVSPETAGEQGFAAMLMKPADAHQIARTVREVLDRAAEEKS